MSYAKNAVEHAERFHPPLRLSYVCSSRLLLMTRGKAKACRFGVCCVCMTDLGVCRSRLKGCHLAAVPASSMAGWLKSAFLSLGPETAKCCKLSVDAIERRMPYPESQHDQQVIRDCQLLHPASCLLAQLNTDVHVQPPVTERQRQVQDARMEQVLHCYASHPQVCHSPD